MALVSGGVLLALTVLMIVVARPHAGEPAPFLRSWPLGQAYVLVAMVSAVSGVALLLTNLGL